MSGDLVSDWLFPRPQRGDKDISTGTFKESLAIARKRAAESYPKLANFNFHDCRHHFTSMGVMAGIDYMTLAKWLGHQNGGVLIGKVCGHLADEHGKRMAQQLVFTPRIVKAKEVAQ